MTEEMERDWELCDTGTHQQVLEVALRNLAQHIRYKEYFHYTLIMAALGWACALPFIIWWFFIK